MFTMARSVLNSFSPLPAFPEVVLAGNLTLKLPSFGANSFQSAGSAAVRDEIPHNTNPIVENIDAVLLNSHFLIAGPEGQNRVAPIRIREFERDRGRREYIKDRHFFSLAQREESPFRLDVQGQRLGEIIADHKLVVLSHPRS